MLTTKNCIYIAKSKINGKVYVGKTHAMLQERIRNHKQDSKRTKSISRFYNHINKYGWDDIEWNISFALPNQKELSEEEKELLCQKEIEYIALYNARDRDLGLNIMPGGIARPITPSSLKKNSEHMKERWRNPEYREQMKKMSNNLEITQKKRQTRMLNGHIAKPKTKKIKQPKPQNIVYKITSITTGKLYFGASTQGLSRIRNNHIKVYQNYNSKFYKHIQIYGIDDLKYEICEVYPIQDKLTKEQRLDLESIMRQYIVKYNTEIDGLNTAPTDVSDEVKQKIGLASRNRSIETRQKLSKKAKGRPNARKGISKYKNAEEKKRTKLDREKENRRNRGLMVQKFTYEQFSEMAQLIRSGCKRNSIIARGYPLNLYNNTKIMIRKGKI